MPPILKKFLQIFILGRKEIAVTLAGKGFNMGTPRGQNKGEKK